ncbi:MAG: hypothetical protein ACI9H8_002286 [Lysobacterales bacterium]|jgi:hypothetical protein
MFTSNPFAELSSWISPFVMQTYLIVMVALVVLGTVYDVLHKKSATYFFNNWQKAKTQGTRPVGGAEVASLAIQTAVVDVLTSGEFCNLRRRIAHLLTMYGFVMFAVTTVIMVFWYPTPATPTPELLPQIWAIGALMVCVGGYWFWFFIRVDVVAEGGSPFRIMRADLFVLSLLASASWALVWACLLASGNWLANLAFGLFLIATTVLFGAVPWSKFAHMFFKPAAALERRISEANGSRNNLPAPANKPKKFGTTNQQTKNY